MDAFLTLYRLEAFHARYLTSGSSHQHRSTSRMIRHSIARTAKGTVGIVAQLGARELVASGDWPFPGERCEQRPSYEDDEGAGDCSEPDMSCVKYSRAFWAVAEFADGIDLLAASSLFVVRGGKQLVGNLLQACHIREPVVLDDSQPRVLTVTACWRALSTALGERFECSRSFAGVCSCRTGNRQVREP